MERAWKEYFLLHSPRIAKIELVQEGSVVVVNFIICVEHQVKLLKSNLDFRSQKSRAALNVEDAPSRSPRCRTRSRVDTTDFSSMSSKRQVINENELRKQHVLRSYRILISLCERGAFPLLPAWMRRVVVHLQGLLWLQHVFF